MEQSETAKNRISKDFNDLQTKSKKMQEEQISFLEQKKLLESINDTTVDSLLGQLHEFVIEIIGDKELSDSQSAEYSEAMGNIEQYVKVKITEKTQASIKVEELQQKSESMQIVVEELSEQLEEINMQNSLLKANMKTNQEEKKGKEVVDIEKLKDYEDTIEQLEMDKSEIQKQLDLVQADFLHLKEEKIENSKKMESLKTEMSTLSSKYSQLEKDKDMLKRGYTDLKMKYVNSKISLKKCKQEQANAISNSNNVSSQNKQPDDDSTTQNNTQIEDNTSDLNLEKFTEFEKKIKELQEKLEEKTRLLHEQQSLFDEKLEKQKLDFEEREEEVMELIQEKEKIEKLLNSFKEKRELALAEILKLKKQLADQQLKQTTSAQSNKQVIQALQNSDETSLNYNINPERLDNFLKKILDISNSLYKNFMIYVATTEESQMIQVESNINKSIELISDFYEYSTAKLRYLQKQKEKSQK